MTFQWSRSAVAGLRGFARSKLTSLSLFYDSARPDQMSQLHQPDACGWAQATSDGYCLNCDPSAGHEDEFGQEWDCTHCGGEGLCWDGSDPLGNCPDEPHRCHACGGSGNRRDQTVF